MPLLACLTVAFIFYKVMTPLKLYLLMDLFSVSFSLEATQLAADSQISKNNKKSIVDSKIQAIRFT